MKRQCEPEAGSRVELFEETWIGQHFKNEEMETGMAKNKGTFRQAAW